MRLLIENVLKTAVIISVPIIIIIIIIIIGLVLCPGTN